MTLRQKAVVGFLNEFAIALQLHDANPFKIRAFENAARAIESCQASVPALIAEGRLGEIDGVGEAIRGLIMELAESGRCRELDALRAEIPPGLFELLQIRGLGGKKVRRLWSELQVVDESSLEAACLAGRVQALKGFGAKTEANILEGIEKRKAYRGRYLGWVASHRAEALLVALRRLPGIERVEIAGSLRRRAEVVKDIDLVAIGTGGGELAAAIGALEGVVGVEMAGETKIVFRLEMGIAVDLRLVEAAQFPFAWLHTTGSREHNVELRGRAKDRGLKLNEYGLFDAAERSCVCDDEAAVYRALGLAYIEPERREGLGECDVAAEGEPPRLVERGDLRGVVHLHTTASDGANSLREMVDAAVAAGYRYIGVTDHSVAASYARGLSVEAIDEQHGAIDALQAERPTIRILKGIEADILQDGSLDYDESVWRRFDFVIASIHSRFRMSGEAITERVLSALENPHVSILGHPSGRLLLKREAYELDFERVLTRCAALGVAVEINGNPRRLDLDWRLHRRALELGVTLAITPDAHSVGELDYVRCSLGTARKGGVQAAQVLN
ncbi:MAG: DNA polymerase/3'-5' exonuclease PolX, partial [Myxococcales bacterium]|nr:DNA polymerase/3'-5' exonuclease PolX [Myxococcales bacterium]